MCFCGSPFLWRPLGSCPVCPVLSPALTLTVILNVNFYCLHTAADGVVLFSASTAGNVSAFRRAIREYMRQTWLVCVNLMACGSVLFLKNGGKNNCGHSMWRMTAPLCKVSVINGTTNVLGRQQMWSGTRGTNIP